MKITVDIENKIVEINEEESLVKLLDTIKLIFKDDWINVKIKNTYQYYPFYYPTYPTYTTLPSFPPNDILTTCGTSVADSITYKNLK